VLSPAGIDRLSRAIAIDPRRNAGWTLVASTLRDVAAEARFRHEAHGTVVVRFAHVDEELDRPHLRTPAFRIVPDTVTEPARELVTKLGQRLLRADGKCWSPRGERDGRDAELIALKAGIRTAIRATVIGADVDAMRSYVAAGLHVLVLDEVPFVDDPRPHTTLCIARTAEDARALARACDEKDNIRLGQLLGYPECCARAFAMRAPRTWSGEFDGAVAAWTGAPVVRLNNLLFAERTRYISFEPCSYACPQAMATADAIANAIAAIDPSSVAIMDERLAADVAIRADGVRARVSVARDRIEAAKPIVRRPGAAVSPEDSVFAEALVGRDIGERGALKILGHDVVVVRFGTGANSSR